MPNRTVTLTEKDIREFARLLRSFDRDLQSLKEERQSEGTVRLFRRARDSAIASDSVATVTMIDTTTMLWDDPERGWDYSEFLE